MAYEDSSRQSALPHKLILEERTKLSVTGVEEVESFDDDRIELRTVRGRLFISGEGLHIGKLSLETGELCAEGTVTGIQYEDVPAAGGGFWARLFG